MSDWRKEMERERYTVPSPPRPDATEAGPTLQFELLQRRLLVEVEVDVDQDAA